MKNSRGEEVEYFWEIQYPFRQFLEKIFTNNYRHKFSLEGNGDYNLVTIKNKLYDIKLTQGKQMLANDNKKFTDKNKEFIVSTIIKNLKEQEYAINSGKFISIKFDNNWIGKIEITKKMQEPK